MDDQGPLPDDLSVQLRWPRPDSGDGDADGDDPAGGVGSAGLAGTPRAQRRHEDRHPETGPAAEPPAGDAVDPAPRSTPC